jgi:hypothetical protein
MFFAGWTKIPLAGRLVRGVANRYGSTAHQAYLLKPEEVDNLLEVAQSMAVGPCDCRQVFKKCQHPVEAEILLAPNRHILLEAMPAGSREISKEEAREILLDCRRRGLIQTMIKCRDTFYAICSCCSCCCVPLRLSKEYGIGKAVVRHRDIVKEFKEYQAANQGLD